MITKKQIQKSIEKHTILPLILTVIIFIGNWQLELSIFGSSNMSPFVTVCYSLAVATYIFKKVLVDLLVDESAAKVTSDL